MENSDLTQETVFSDADSEKGAEEDISTGETAAEDTTETKERPETEIYVDVCGAVQNPGVYKLKEGSRVFAAIEAAGGCNEDAQLAAINQAMPLTDGQQIYVYSVFEATEQIITGVLPQENGFLPESGGKVNLNTADEAVLATLSGIGPSKARAILAYREEHGSFSAIEELMEVPGIKEGTYLKIKDDITTD
ncbi:MAG: ComEA family DNA-binding protein [Blautia sp.]|nr:ComEA family DNA-binding protein [Blautia sp.]